MQCWPQVSHGNRVGLDGGKGDGGGKMVLENSTWEGVDDGDLTRQFSVQLWCRRAGRVPERVYGARGDALQAGMSWATP